MKKKLILFFLFAILFTLNLKAVNQYDSVILNGNVYNSSSKEFLEKYNIGIKNGKIDIITKDNITGKTTVDATDKIVLPAFIDSFQRHYGDIFEEFRLFDGVVTSIYVTEEEYDTFLLNNNMNISYINRIMIKDITNIYANSSQDEAYTDFKSKVTKSIADGFAGFYIKPTTVENIDLDFIDKSFPLYIDLENISENLIIPFLNQLVENGNTERNIHIISANKFYNVMDELLNFVKEYDNFSVGGYPFSYVNLIPNNENSLYLEPLVNKNAVNKDNKSTFVFSQNNFKDKSKYSIVGAINNETINSILLNDKFISESYDNIPGAMMTTQDANTFMGRLNLSIKQDFLSTAIDAQTNSIKNVFNSFDSPLLNKGVIEIGADADIIVVDTKKLSPHSSIADVAHKSTGITDLFREGVLIIENEKLKENTPKARWIKRSVGTFKELDDFKGNLKGQKAENINAINYDNDLYISIKDIARYLNVVYEESQGIVTLGGIIKLGIGSNNFSVGTNKSEMKKPAILINKGIYASYNSIQNIFNGYYIFEQSGNEIDIKRDSKASLLEMPLNDEEININLDNKNILYVYLLSIVILIVFIIFLNNHKRKIKREEVK